ncbi:hypothetical protein Tco_1488450, partial [Tanacetum coccineum]
MRTKRNLIFTLGSSSKKPTVAESSSNVVSANAYGLSGGYNIEQSLMGNEAVIPMSTISEVAFEHPRTSVDQRLDSKNAFEFIFDNFLWRICVVSSFNGHYVFCVAILKLNVQPESHLPFVCNVVLAMVNTVIDESSFERPADPFGIIEHGCS